MSRLLFIPFGLGLVVSAILVWVCRAAALRLGYTASRGFRQSGGRPVALSGGIALTLTLFICSIALGAFAVASLMLACSAALLSVGVTSDLLRLKPATRLVAQIAVASIFLMFDYRLHWSDSLTIDSIVTVFWIVGVISAFNLLDNMDGLCAGIALIAGTAFLITLLPIPSASILLDRAEYLAVLLGAIAGLLIFNVYPASVALGHGGGLVIGLNMAALTLQIAPGRGSNVLSVVAVPVLVLLIPIVDAALVAVSRVLRGPSTATGSNYPSQRLVAIGLSERTAVGLLWVLSAMSGFIAVLADRGDQGLTGLMVAMFVIGLALFSAYLSRVRVHEGVDPDRLPATITPLGIDFGYRRRLVEVILDVLLVSVAYYAAYRLRFESTAEFAENFPNFARSFPIVLGTQMLALFVVGAYRGMWRYFSLADGVTFVEGVFLGVVSSIAAIVFLHGLDGYSPSVFIVYGMLLFILLVGSRASFRLTSEFVQRQRHAGRRLVIYGASDRGSIAVRQLLNDPLSSYRILGFVDDDARKRNVRVHGYRVIGGYDHLVGMIMAGEVDAVAITEDRPATQGLSGLCVQYGVALQRVAYDWQEVPAAEVYAGAGSDGRIVPFTDATRDRGPRLRIATPALAGMPAESPIPPIRVLHIITRLILGGAQENTLYTAIAQHKDPRFDVTLLVGIDEAGEGNMFTQATRAGVNTVVLPSLLREIRPLTDLKAVIDIYRFLRQGSYDIVHTHSSKAGVVGRLAARAARVPFVVHTVHGFAFHEFQSAWKNRLFIALERVCAPITDVIVSVSARLGQAAVSHGIGRPEQHMTIFSGIDLDLFLSVRDRLSVEQAKQRAGLPPHVPVVGKVARFFALKGHEQFLAAATEIARAVPDVHFLLVGDGPLREQLLADAACAGLEDRFVLVGRVPPQDVPDYLQAMDVVVHTSLREGIARVLPQAGAVGKPVVTFELDGAPEVVRHGISGYLVQPVDVSAIADRTITLLGDADLRQAFGDAGREFAAENFSVERMVERINGLYLDNTGKNALQANHGARVARRP